MIRCLAAALLLCAFGLAPALGAEPPPVKPAADAARKAADDPKGLRALVTAPEPDAWLVAAELLRAGESKVARALAAAGKAPGGAGLAAAVEASRAPAATLAALTKAHADSGRAAWKDVVAALEGLAPGTGLHVVEAAWLAARARDELAFDDTASARRLRLEAADLYRTAGEAAETLGWSRRASEAYEGAGRMLWFVNEKPRAPAMKALFQQHLAMEVALGSTAGQGRAHYRVAVALEALEQDDAVLVRLDLATPLLAKAKDSEYRAKALGLRADVLGRRGRLAEAYRLNCEAAGVLRAPSVEGLPRRFHAKPGRLVSSLIDRLLGCATLAERQGDLEEAGEKQQEAARRAEAAQDRWLQFKVAAFSALLAGERHRLDGAFAKARAAYDEALRIYDGLNLAAEAADVRRRITELLRARGELSAAVTMATEMVAAVRKQCGRAALARALLVMARIYMDMGDLDGADAPLVEAVALAEMQGDLELVGYASLERAGWWRARGKLGKSLSLLEQALRETAGHDLTELRAMLQLELAVLLVRLGEHDRAEILLAEAVASFEAIKHLRGQGDVARAQAFFLYQAGRLAEARTTLQRLVALQERAGNPVGVVLARRILAFVCFDLERYKESREHWQAVADGATATGDTSLGLHAQLGMARARYWGGDRTGGRQALLEALGEARKSEDPEIEASAELALAQVLYRENDDAGAMAHADSGLALVSKYALDLAEGEDAALRSAFITELYAVGAKAALSSQSPADLYRFMERARASTLTSMLDGADSMRGVELSEELQAAEAKARAATAAGRASLKRAKRRRSPAKIRAARKELRAAQVALRDVLRTIRREVRGAAAIDADQLVAWTDVQKELAPADVLLIYGTVERHVDGKAEERLIAVRIAKKGQPTIVDVASAQAVQGALEALMKPEGDGVVAGKEAALAKLVFRGIDRKGATRLLISPGDSLPLVPFGLLDKTRDVALLPSASTFALLKATATQAGSRILGIGNPIYGNREGSDLPPLYESADEIKAIAKDPKDHLLGKQATETRFFERIAEDHRWRAIHFACHGLVDPAGRTQPSLALTADAENDGFLTAREIFNLSIPADLVTLSACETGRGKIIRGEGLAGLMRAFMQAGAPRVLCSLWKVEDEATAELMKHFYRTWKDGAGGVSAATALRQAQAHIRALGESGKHPAWKHPDYWAAWVLWGLPD